MRKQYKNKSVPLKGETLRKQQEIARKIQLHSPSGKKAGIRVSLICKHCDEEFNVVESQADRRKFCSRACSAQYKTGKPGKPLSEKQKKQISEAQKKRFKERPES